MGRISAIIPDELEKDFRHKVVEKFGGRRGDISKGFIEAFEMWIKDKQESISVPGTSRDTPHP
ncbi:MAG: hypothetical protein KAJ39_02195 [Gammaproteobacteria bacterium]|nr:hypothetical protein [Gammaproteobacteria bacterium]